MIRIAANQDGHTIGTKMKNDAEVRVNWRGFMTYHVAIVSVVAYSVCHSRLHSAHTVAGVPL